MGCAPGSTLTLPGLQLYIHFRMSVLGTANRCCVLVSCVVGLGPGISIQCAGARALVLSVLGAISVLPAVSSTPGL